LAVAELTLKPAASCVSLLTSRLMVCPLGTPIERGEPEDNMPFVGSKVRVAVERGPEE
jgi:hypothetical protein